MSGWSTFQTIHDPFLWREKINPVPWLVTKWEQVNPSTMRWYLRQGVKFHNGENFTPESVKVSFEQYSATSTRSPWRSQLNVVKRFKISDPHGGPHHQGYEQPDITAINKKLKGFAWHRDE